MRIIHSSLREAYAYLAGDGTTNTNKGGLIYLVNPITVNSDMTVGLSTYEDAAEKITIDGGGISVRRYSRPDADHNVDRLFNHASNTKELFVVEAGGSLTLDGVSVDGHGEAVTQAGPKMQYTVAPAVTAEAPAISVKDGGTVNFTGGTQIFDNVNSNGPDAMEQSGIACVKGKVNVTGTVHLGTGKYITVNTGNQTGASELHLLLDDPCDERVIAQYTIAPDSAEIGKYILPDAIMEHYVLAIETNKVVLKNRTAAYVDGINGNDDNNDGTTPDRAVKTLKKAYQILQKSGGTIYIVDTVTIPEYLYLTDTEYRDTDIVTIENGKTVTISRYAQPIAAQGTAPTLTAGYSKESCQGELLKIQNGSYLMLNRIRIDGHSAARTDGADTVQADGVKAQTAMICVENGTLAVTGTTVLKNNNNTSKASFGGAVWIGPAGEAQISGGAFSGNVSPHGAGIYDAGTLKMAGEIDLDTDQEIYLEKNQKIQVTDALSTVSRTLLVDFPEDSYVDRHVVAEYAEGLTPEKELYILKQTAVMTESRSFPECRRSAGSLKHRISGNLRSD